MRAKLKPSDFYRRDFIMPAHSYISVVRYHASTRELYVTLRKSGKRYRYRNVPAKVFADFLQAQNKGSFINLHVIHGRYEGEVVEQVATPPPAPRISNWLSR